MTANTKIEWADSTFNSWSGCTKISPACDHCYAEALSKRAPKTIGQWGNGAPRRRTSTAYWKQPLRWNAREFAECSDCGYRFDTGGLSFVCAKCVAAGNRGFNCKPARRRVFCASLADWLDNEVPGEWLADLLAMIEATPNLDWLLLTKRIGNWRSRMGAAMDSIVRGGTGSTVAFEWMRGNAPPNVWLGATVCNQSEADRDIPKLLATPAAIRFLSIEPMLGPITFRWAAWEPIKTDAPTNHLDGLRRLDWVICGGESGPNARPMHPYWAGALRDQCAAAGVPFLFKQWGEWKPISDMDDAECNALYRSNVKARPHEDQAALDDCYGRKCTVENGIVHIDGSLHGITEPMACLQGKFAMQTFKVGKHAAGRLLDGIEHNGVPA